MSDESNNIDEQTQEKIRLDDEEENFIDLNHAVEVKVEENDDDDDVPMDEDDGDNDENSNEIAGEAGMADVIKDMSIQTISSHRPSSVFTVATYLNKESNTLSIISGGGDDKAFLHKVANDNVLTTVALKHEHTDSVSSVATNESLVSSDLKKTPKYVAVGAYDGTVVLYNPDTAEEIQVLDGPTDVEFIAFHPKGGSVSIVH